MIVSACLLFCFPASLRSAEFPQFMLGLSCEALLHLHPLLRRPWLCRGFAGISVLIPAGLRVRPGAGKVLSLTWSL